MVVVGLSQVTTYDDAPAGLLVLTYQDFSRRSSRGPWSLVSQVTMYLVGRCTVQIKAESAGRKVIVRFVVVRVVVVRVVVVVTCCGRESPAARRISSLH